MSSYYWFISVAISGGMPLHLVVLLPTEAVPHCLGPGAVSKWQKPFVGRAIYGALWARQGARMRRGGGAVRPFTDSGCL